MMNFDKDYFDNIWGTVHRHDYGEGLATQLIQKYGQVRFLDIGCGCGFLVKTLRDKGADAWGLEVSDYAIENTCAPGYVLKGDVRDIPYKDNSFDVVFSQGLWDYVKEEDIQPAYLECNRVGKIQDHVIDTTQDTAPWSKDFVTYKPKEWWDEKLKLPKILVACPNHESKEYCFKRWIDNVKSLTYPNYDIFVSDNSPNDDFLNRWKDQVPIKRIDTTGINELRVLRQNLSYEQIREEFLKKDYSHLMVIESDVIPPKNVIETMLKWGKDTDWTAHAYPERGGTEPAMQGIGCSLLSRRLLAKFNFKDLADNYLTDGGLWMQVRPDKTMKTMELWGYMQVQHLGA